jgi:hypothetical protein
MYGPKFRLITGYLVPLALNCVKLLTHLKGGAKVFGHPPVRQSPLLGPKINATRPP